ncbi:MAG: NAD(P)-dependent oxidoreductase [Clostridia bacterium]|nr:NAD(P)-dependent oxidoreductase [Clostridia bacterium]
MKVAVAGSDGFVGRIVCSQLEAKGHSIIKIDIRQGTDLCDSNIIDQIEPIDCFIHLANLVYVPASYQYPEKFYRINYLTTLNALEICRRHNARLIYASSYIYGSPQYLPVDEKHPVSPFNPYSQTKVICEKMCEGFNRDFKVKVSILRPFNIYGVGQTGMLLIPEIIGQIKENKTTIQLKTAYPRRDYVNVKDVAGAFVACLNDTNDYNIYNVCSASSFSVREITEIINKNLKNKVEFIFEETDRPNEIYETFGSCEKLKSIGWQNALTFEEGIIEIIKSENL